MRTVGDRADVGCYHFATGCLVELVDDGLVPDRQPPPVGVDGEWNARIWDVREVVFQFQDEAIVTRFAREVLPALRG